ncbi:hypothetical protein PUN28_002119 [Cardiocondyla obscurior]|uniref:Uncharacterized protein n=1 Tax=Cardiocondyla obscurior TaxID=286306 RepID=A0AAW2GSQ6_9HYME
MVVADVIASALPDRSAASASDVASSYRWSATKLLLPKPEGVAKIEHGVCVLRVVHGNST